MVFEKCEVSKNQVGHGYPGDGAAASRPSTTGKCVVASCGSEEERSEYLMEVNLVKKIATALSIPFNQIHIYSDNTVCIDQLNICNEKGMIHLNKGTALTCQKMVDTSCVATR